jgi:hypothetical protein
VDPVSRPGDIWVLGDHWLICGDSTKRETYQKLLAGRGGIWSSPTRLIA